MTKTKTNLKEASTKQSTLDLNLTKDYQEFFQELKEKILSSRLKAAKTVNQQAIKLYWQIGKQIIKKQQNSTWGNGLIYPSDLKMRNL